MKNISDEQLIADYLKGDEKSLEVLIKRYLRPIYSFVYHFIGGSQDAEDITQEVFVRVWKNLKKFNGQKKFKSWVFEIAKNSSIDFIRKKKTIPFSRFENGENYNIIAEKIASPLMSAGELLDNKNLGSELIAVIKELSPKYRAVFSYRYNNGLTFREIAESLGESINTVKSRYRRALAALRKTIKL